LRAKQTFRALLAAATVAAVAGGVALFASPANAAGYGDPSIITPKNNQVVSTTWTGPAKIDFSDAPAGNYNLELENQYSGSITTTPVTYDGTQDIVSVPVSIPRAGDWSLHVESVDDWYTSSNEVYFTAQDPIQLTNVRVSTPTLYSLHRDGYRDHTNVTFSANTPAALTMRVKNSNGNVVRTMTRDHGYRGRQSFTWNGMSQAGRPVPVGTYKIELSAKDRNGHTSTTRARVKVATKTVSRMSYNTRRGYWNSTQSHRGNCQVNFYDYDETTQLDCWAGTYAQVGYRFKVPTDAHNLTWDVTGHRGCCSPGLVSLTGKRTSPTSYVVTVKVTNWRSYTIRRVELDYRHTVQL
jgi:flagellar hook assembly protein FlgD